MYLRKNQNKFVLFYFLILYVNCEKKPKEESKYYSVKLNENIQKIQYKNFDEVIQPNQKNKDKKWFLVFYTRECRYCNIVLNIMNTQLVNYYKNSPNIKLGIIDLEENDGVWLGLRFNISTVPYIISIENNLIYEYKEMFELEKARKFIESEKNIEDSKEIPESVGIFDRFFHTLKITERKITEVMQNKFKKYNLKVEWNSIYSYILIFTIIIILILIQIFLFVYVDKHFGKKNDDIQIANKNDVINEKIKNE